MLKQILFLLPFALIILAYPFWLDPDSIGTYNTICDHNGQVEIPIITKIILSIIPCSILIWKIFHLLLLLLILWVFSKEYSLSIIGLVSFVAVFFLSLEDDLLAFLPILVFGIWVLSAKKNDLVVWSQISSPNSLQKWLLLIGLILLLILGFGFWKGSFLIMGILLAYLIHPPLSIIPSVFYILSSNFNTWGLSAEASIGNGFLIGQIGLMFLLYDAYKRKPFFWKNEYYLLLSFCFLTFFQPKWGEWLIIPLAFLLEPHFDKNKSLQFFGIWMLLLSLFTAFVFVFPNINQLTIIKESVKIQESGKKLVSDWGVGHYVNYYGGKATQAGGYKGEQDTKNSYWIGPDINCQTILFNEKLFLQKC